VCPDEFSEFFRAEAGPLLAFLRRAGFGWQQAFDAGKAALAQACLSWPDLPRPRAWVRTAALRAINTEGSQQIVAGGGVVGARVDFAPAGLAHDQEQLLKTLAGLPERQRMVISWSLDGFDDREIAEQLGVPTATVREHRRHARHDWLEQTNRGLVESVKGVLDIEAMLQVVKPPITTSEPIALQVVRREPHVEAERAPSAEPPPNTVDGSVSAAVEGDPKAVRTILTYVRPLVVKYCRARVGRQERSFGSADDVAQEVCLAVLKALPTYRDQGRPFLAFVYGIAAHKVADAHRAVARNRADPMLEVPEMPESSAGPEQVAMQGDLSRRIKELLEILPDKQREIVVLRTVVGLSAEETAEAVGSTPGAVRVAQHRALGRLRKHLGNGHDL
jgi:RNA polymerase sigma-70 factor, ECF subfamily